MEPVSIMGEVIATGKRNAKIAYPEPLETLLYLDLGEIERLPDLLDLGIVHLEAE